MHTFRADYAFRWSETMEQSNIQSSQKRSNTYHLVIVKIFKEVSVGEVF